jgi:hypothetical protein
MPRSSLRYKAGAILAAVLSVVTWGIATAPASSAATCIGVTGWTTRNSLGSGSTEFAKYNATHSDCRDFQAAYTVSASDYVWGNFYGGDLIGASWHAGSRGWQWVSTANNGWDVLLTSVAAGTPMRGRGYSYAQNVRYVH